MDSRTELGGEPRSKLANKEPEETADAPFAAIETRVLELLASDVDAAIDSLAELDRLKTPLTPLQRARRERLIGRCHEAKSEHDQAIEWTARALASFERLDYRPGVLQCRRTLFASYIHSGRYPQARECARLMLADAAGSRQEKLKVHANLGNLEHRLHHYAKALDHYQTALALLDSGDPYEGVVLYNTANVLVCLNQFSQAEVNYQKALALFKRGAMSLYQAHVLQALGGLYSILGQFFHAVTHIEEARSVYRGRGDRVGAALCDLDLFQLKIRLNKVDEALAESESLIDKFDRLGLPYETAMVYYQACLAALALDDRDLAEIYLDEAVRLFDQCGNQHYLAMCSMQRGMLSLQDGDHAEARRQIERARTVFVRKKLRELELQCLLHLSRIDARFFDDVAYRRVRFLLSGAIGHQLRTQALLLVSAYWRAKGQLKRAIKSRLEAVMTIEESRASILSKDLRESFFGDKAEAYETLVEWLFQWSNPKAPELVFKVLSLSRSRQFSEQLSQFEHLPPVLNRNEPSLLEMNKLETRLGHLARKLRNLSGAPEGAEAEKAELLSAYEQAWQAMRRLKLRMRDEARLGLFFPVDFSAQEIQRNLPDGCLAVSYFVGERQFYRIELDRHFLKTFSFPLYEGFRRDLNLLHRALANRLYQVGGEAEAALTRLEALLAPRMIRKRRHVVFIPHKSLHMFPFAMLRVNSALLLETHAVTVCPNLATLYFSLKRRAPALAKPMFFLSDQPEDPAAPERDCLAAQYPNALTFRELRQPPRQRATLAADFIHFAGHCLFDRKKPDRSYMQMGGSRVYLSKLKNLRFDQAFINLASCQSGSLSLMTGNEPYGFVASFFAAGAVNIMAALWDLDDQSTGEWMVAFYRHIDRGLPEAYRRACLETRARRPEPHHWAGLCLLGKP